MREQFICGLQISLSRGGGAYSRGLTNHGTHLSLLTPKVFRRERVVMILLAALLPIEIACGGGSSQMTGSGGPGGTVHQYATGKGPNCVSAGDFNGDKILDLAVTNSTDNSVSVLLGNGDGTFQQHVDYPAIPVAPGTSLTSIAVADFNGDGKQDLVSDGLMLGNGDGTFQAIVPLSVTNSASETRLVNSYSASAGTSAAGTVAVGDMNGDGKPDLVFLGGIVLSNGDGTFRGGDTLALLGYECCVALGDINGDGKLDVVESTPSWHGSGWVEVYFGNGDGTIDYSNMPSQAAGQFGYAVAVSDFNGDGKQDIVGGEQGGVYLLLGKGDGTFQFSSDLETTAGAVQAIAVADLNADGTPDIVAVNGTAFVAGVSIKSTNTMSILLGNGNGTFQTHVEYPTGSNPTSVAVGDFNGDGKLDLAVTNSADNTVSILLGNGDGTFR
jgi:hypothetical protein